MIPLFDGVANYILKKNFVMKILSKNQKKIGSLNIDFNILKLKPLAHRNDFYIWKKCLFRHYDPSYEFFSNELLIMIF